MLDHIPVGPVPVSTSFPSFSTFFNKPASTFISSSSRGLPEEIGEISEIDEISEISETHIENQV